MNEEAMSSTKFEHFHRAERTLELIGAAVLLMIVGVVNIALD